MYISNLTLEVTRRCNMTCEHCLRGPARREDMSVNIVDSVLSTFDQIGVLTFSGGEPLLNVNLIIHTLDTIIARGIYLDAFYIVTNGLRYSQKLMDKLEYMYYNYCSDEGVCGLAVSKDMHHADSYKIDVNRGRYLQYEFYHPRDKEHSYPMGTDSYVQTGRARKLLLLDHYNELEKYPMKNGIIDCDLSVKAMGDDSYDGTLYINARGDIIPCPNMSYKTQKKYKLGSYTDIEKYLKGVPKSEDY